MKATLEGTLRETASHFGAQVAQIRRLISSIEAQLSDVCADIEWQNLEYQQLMHTKTQLEWEIATYHRPLTGQDAYYKNLPTTRTA